MDEINNIQRGKVKLAKNWYPVINYDNCIECGTCIGKCSHGVYNKEIQKPEVIYPDGCVDGCHGCQQLCPAEAITYFGDSGEKKSASCNCK
jgi:NAD-dependent dihydropyrimidine dehydrogenase PreA subunit